MKQLAAIIMFQLVMDLGASNPLSITLNSPTDGSTVSGTITLSATPVNTMGPISRVEYYIDGKLFATVTNPAPRPTNFRFLNSP